MGNIFTTENAALLLIDRQVGTMQLIENIPLDVVKRNTLALAKAAKILDLPFDCGLLSHALGEDSLLNIGDYH